jgi:hypothetical protein
MDQQAHNQTPARREEPHVDPIMLPDVATEPHPSAHVAPLPTQNASPGDTGRLQEVPPEILDAARKVGGFKKLAEIAGQLDRDGQ